MGCAASTAVAEEEGRLNKESSPRTRRFFHATTKQKHHQRPEVSLRFLVVGESSSFVEKELLGGLVEVKGSSQVDVVRGQSKACFSVHDCQFELWDAGEMTLEEHGTKDSFDAIVFAVSLARYKDTISEDGTTMNSMARTLQDFRRTCRTFRDSPVMVFFTDQDEFAYMLETTDSLICQQDAFRDCPSRLDTKESVHYFAQRFYRASGYDKDVSSSPEPFVHLVQSPRTTIQSFLDHSHTILMTKELVRSGFLTVREDSGRTLETSRTDLSRSSSCGVPSVVSF